MRTIKDATVDEIGTAILTLFQYSGINPGDIKDVALASVVPSLSRVMQESIPRYLKIQPFVIGPETKTGMPVQYDNPGDVGIDRIINAVAGYERYHAGLIIIDFGTATTFDCVSREGVFMGGVITPGLITASDALFERTSKLPKIETFIKPGNIIAKNTVSAMNAGIIYGYAGLVDGIVGRMKREFGYEVKVLATGGIAPLIAGESPAIDSLEEHLTMEGMKIIYERNR